jgi:hypothetical protein
MIGGVQPKVLLTQDEDGNLKLDENFKEMIYGDPIMNWKLIRERDGLKERHEKPAIGRSLIMSPFNEFFTWQTTTITEIVEQRDDSIKFKTQNSNYELFKIK